eukprot:3108160-Rhodomonas_salina.1
MLTAQRLRGLLAALLFLPPIRPLAFFTGETDRDRARATAMSASPRMEPKRLSGILLIWVSVQAAGAGGAHREARGRVPGDAAGDAREQPNA